MTETPTIALLSAGHLHIGGVETHLLSLIAGDIERRFRWLVLAPMLETFAEQVREAGGEPVYWSSGGLFNVASMGELRRIFCQQRVALVHSHDARASFQGGLAGRCCHLPVVNTIHAPSYNFDCAWASAWRKSLYRACEKWVNRWLVDYTIFVSSRLLDEALALGLMRRAKTEAIPNGIGLAKFREPHADIFPHLPRPRFCFIGRLVNEKGLDVLIQAVALLARATSAFHLLIVGDGPLRAETVANVHASGIESQVTFLGFRQDIPAILQASDVYLVSSRSEGMPIGLLEALASGLPCIVTCVGEMPQVVHDCVEGLVVPVENPAAFARAMRALLDDAEQRTKMAAAARTRGAEFDERHTCARVYALYDFLLAASAPAERSSTV